MGYLSALYSLKDEYVGGGEGEPVPPLPQPVGWEARPEEVPQKRHNAKMACRANKYLYQVMDHYVSRLHKGEDEDEVVQEFLRFVEEEAREVYEGIRHKAMAEGWY